MSDALSILRQYWRHENFRDPQLQVIESVLAGRDTFALLPTGGGKSICFQVPAIVKPGICLVISPLVALMKDQVENLQTRGIKAMALTGGIRLDDMSDLLDNAQFGDFKFLYLSPERLQSEWILDRLKNLPVNLIAVDEAHCVSQWGHDFRPAYLKISMLKTLFPKVPFLALTATAVPRVREDVIAQLGLRDVAMFQKSFARENLAYWVADTEDKLFSIENILRKNPGPAIIYVRNRKSCHDFSAQLSSLGFNATFYHGGLPPKEKALNMKRWMREESQVIIATNAFGMGIDKANVQTVIHIQLPENLENYYQEAGRAGRDGNPATAILLSSPSDIIQAESQFLAILPDRKFLLDIYVKLCNYLQIAYGEGMDSQFRFSLNRFCVKYAFPPLKTYNALQFLDREGILSLSQEYSEKIMLQFVIESREVIRYCSLNPNDEEMILAILRTYPGIYDMATALNLPLVSKKSGKPEADIFALLSKLRDRQIVSFESHHSDATLIFNEVREDDKTINRVARHLESQNRLKSDQLASVVNYVRNRQTCKSRMLLEYLGDPNIKDCGICSVCCAGKKKKPDLKMLALEIAGLLGSGPLSSREIEARSDLPSEDVIFALRMLLENGQISIRQDSKYQLIS